MYKVISRVAILGAVLLSTPMNLWANSQKDSTAVQSVSDTMQTPSQEMFIADEVAAIVGDNCILNSDIEKAALQIREQRKMQGSLSKRSEYEEAFEMLLTRGLMATRARMDSLDKDLPPVTDMVERQVMAMTQQAGSVAELERIHGKPIFQIKSDITLDYKQMQLAQTMETAVNAKVVVDKSDVVEFAKTIGDDPQYVIPEQYSFSQIIKLPPQTDERKYSIRERLLEFRKRILAKEITFGALARLYSADPATAIRGGEMPAMEAGRFDPAFAETALGLDPGEVSEIVESEYGFHIIEMIDKKGNIIHVRHILLKPEFTLEEEREVVAQLDSITKEINNGKLTFGEAALHFSDDEKSKQNGGKAFNKAGYDQTGNIRAASTYFAAEDMQTMPVDYQMVSTLKIGGISTPYQSMDDKGNLVQKIIHLDAILPVHTANIVDDYDMLEANAKKLKQVDVIDKWIDDKISTVYVEIKDQYLEKYHLEREGWAKAAQRTKNKENLDITLPDKETMLKVAKDRAARNAAELAAQKNIEQDSSSSKEQEATK